MDKLLELIKQYWIETFNDKKLSKVEYEEKSGTFYWKYQPLPGMKLEQGQFLHRTTVLSKDFGFVEWLVDNDKIDFYNVLKENGTFRKEFYAIENKKEYERLIMLLSIQDNPIEFLLSIIK